VVRSADALSPSPPHAPCSRAQRRFWALDQLDPGSPALNVAVRWRIEGSLPASIVERALRMVIGRHDMLRTRFAAPQGVPRQIVEPQVAFKVPVIDLSALSAEEAADEAERIAAIEARTPFDLAAAPLIRATLVRYNPGHAVLLVTAHHAVCDGWSIGIIAHEFGAICAAIEADRTPELPELPLTYADYALWQAETETGPAWREALEQWARKLRNLPYFELATDHPRPSTLTTKSDIESLLIERALSDRAQKFAAGKGYTFFMLALAAFFVMLHRHSGKSDIAIGTQVAGRDDIDLENIIGVFINTVILRCTVEDGAGCLELLDAVRDTVLDAFENQQVPLESLLEILRPKREINRNPLFSINFIYQRSFVQNADHGGFRLIDLPSRSAGAMYDLNFFMVERPEGWRLSCEYKTSLFNAATVRQLLQTLCDLMGAIADDAARPVGSLPAGAVTSPAPPAGPEPAGPAVAPAAVQPPPKSSSDSTEARLTGLWQEVLNHGDIRPDDNFFDLGGHSLLAAQLLLKIEQEFSKKLSLAAIFKAPTIELQAGLLRENQIRTFDFRNIVRLQAEGSRAPIIALHNTGLFFNLSRKLGKDQPFTCLQLFDPSLGKTDIPGSLEEIAAGYVTLIRHAQPAGPYVLLGWCVAGALAYEVALRLYDPGLPPPTLIVIDTWAPAYLTRLPPLRRLLADYSYRLNMLARDWRNVEVSSRSVLAFLQKRRSIRKLLELFRPRPRIESDAPASNDEAHDLLVFRSLLAARDRYRPRRASFPVIVIRSSEEPSGLFLDRDLGWSRLTSGEIDTTAIEGGHVDMFSSPYVDEIAAYLSKRLDPSRRQTVPLQAAQTPYG